MKIFLLIIIMIVLVINILYYSSVENINITITKTERIVESSGLGENLSITSKYLVFTQNETFENTDSWMFWKFNSSDFNGKLIPNSTYKVKVIGWRVPFLSWYRNIVKIY